MQTQNRSEPRVESGAMLVVLQGERTGERFPLTTEPLTIGSGSDCEVRLDDAGLGERHARLAREHAHWVVHDLGDPRGTFVNDVRVQDYALRDGDQLRFGRTILRLLSGRDLDTRLAEERFHASRLDGLTRMANREAFENALGRDLDLARRQGTPMALVKLDLDGFDQLNREHGETTGDEVLQAVSRALQARLRRQDELARVGADSFAVILRGTDAAEAHRVAEQLRRAIDALHPTGRPVTASIGVVMREGDEEAGELTKRAWAKVLRAQELGGNRVA